MFSHKTHNFTNLIARVYFAGFESDTLRLQREGWQLSYSQQLNSYERVFRLAMKHEKAGVYAISSPTIINMDTIMRNGSCAPDWLHFNICHMSNDFRVRILPMPQVAFQAFDAIPQFEDTKEFSFEEFVPFKPLNSEAPEIFLDKKTAAELIDLAIKKQEPKQAQIREENRKRKWREKEGANEDYEGYDAARDIKAQIMCIA